MNKRKVDCERGHPKVVWTSKKEVPECPICHKEDPVSVLAKVI